MAKTIIQDFDATTDENMELKAAVRGCITELETVNNRMAQRQVRIHKLKTETRAMLNELKAN